jgi:hypothetical protein
MSLLIMKSLSMMFQRLVKHLSTILPKITTKATSRTILSLRRSTPLMSPRSPSRNPPMMSRSLLLRIKMLKGADPLRNLRRILMTIFRKSVREVWQRKHEVPNLHPSLLTLKIPIWRPKSHLSLPKTPLTRRMMRQSVSGETRRGIGKSMAIHLLPRNIIRNPSDPSTNNSHNTTISNTLSAVALLPATVPPIMRMPPLEYPPLRNVARR